MKTYENFITDLFKKIPTEMKELSEVLVDFINKNNTSYIATTKYKSDDGIALIADLNREYKKFIWITIKKRQREEEYYNVIGLHYGQGDVFYFTLYKSLYFALLNNMDLYHFLEDILSSNYDSPIRGNFQNLDPIGHIYIIELNNVRNIINKITLENLEDFKAAKDFNL